MLNKLRITSFLIMSIFLAAPVWSTTTPVIFSTVINNSKHQISITGNSFSPAGAAPTVALDNTILTLVSFTNNTVSANMLTGLKAGSYRISLTSSTSQTATFHRYHWCCGACWSSGSNRTSRTNRSAGSSGASGCAGSNWPSGTTGRFGSSRNSGDTQRILF